jgi:hypothetical protein
MIKTEYRSHNLHCNLMVSDDYACLQINELKQSLLDNHARRNLRIDGERRHLRM